MNITQFYEKMRCQHYSDPCHWNCIGCWLVRSNALEQFVLSCRVHISHDLGHWQVQSFQLTAQFHTSEVLTWVTFNIYTEFTSFMEAVHLQGLFGTVARWQIFDGPEKWLISVCHSASSIYWLMAIIIACPIFANSKFQILIQLTLVCKLFSYCFIIACHSCLPRYI